ncbi:MAG: TIR domain-containing protein, partial [bacterium]|nr:TIR domain-containing protein [bacterium]
WKVNQIRSIPNITGSSAAGFQDASLWEEAKKKGDKAIKDMIDEALKNTSVTLVCVTYGTAERKYINYEIDKSLEKGNGLVAVQIHDLKDQNGNTGSAGAIPKQIESNGFKAYKYTNKEALARWIEEAATLAGK